LQKNAKTLAKISGFAELHIWAIVRIVFKGGQTYLQAEDARTKLAGA
jgi:hypothetical protein